MATDPSGRPSSSSSAASLSPTIPPLNIPKKPQYSVNSQNPSPTSSARVPSPSANSSNTSPPNFSRPGGQLVAQNDVPSRKPSPLGITPQDGYGHRRQHSQGFFEPSLPSAGMSGHQQQQQQPAPPGSMSASRIAAQAAMQHLPSSQQSSRSRSSTIPPQQDHSSTVRKVSSPPPPLNLAKGSEQRRPSGSGGGPGLSYQNGTVGGRNTAATTAANLAFPRSPVHTQSSGMEQFSEETGPSQKQKGEKSKMKLFSKPKHIGISRDKDKDKDSDRREKPLPSPSKVVLPGTSGLSRMVNASTTSLTEQVTSSSSSMYNLSNSSAATVVPADRPSNEKDKEKDKDKEKHKHHFLSRPKLKLRDKDKEKDKDKDKDDHHHHLPLSSANSNSKPLDPSAPQSFYSFAPSSPSTTSFGKSVSGLDLRHGGRALREKKKEEKEKGRQEKAAAAAAAAAATTAPPSSQDSSRDGDLTSEPAVGVHESNAAMQDVLQIFGLQNMSPEDAWDFLKAKLLVLFEGEDVRIALEDLNKLVTVHLRCCVQNHMPSVVVEDLRDLLHTGFSSINCALLSVREDSLVPYLAQTWLFVFGTVLPFIQAVFLPLDQEFKGRGLIMNPREATEFWGALPDGGAMGDQLDVRDIVLSAFRDTVILNRYDILKTTFSQLSLDKINLNPMSNEDSRRPSVSSGAGLDPKFSSYNSQSTTVLNTPGTGPIDGNAPLRSRATSNTSSNPDLPFLQSALNNFSTSLSPPQNSFLAQNQSQQAAPDPSFLITETVGRMFQCISVLASVRSDDEAQAQVENLSKAIKMNWLGRARTGRDRRGFVGGKVRNGQPLRKYMDERIGRTGPGLVGGD